MSEKALKLIAKEKKERTGRLNLSNCGLTEWPKELFELTWLEELVMGDNWEWDEEKGKFIFKLNYGAPVFLIYIDERISNLSNLKLLYLIDCNINDISNLKSLKTLEKLDLSDNEIGRIEGLDNLIKLKKLNLSKNQINKIENLDSLNSLNELKLYSNNIERIENLNKLTTLTSLNLSSNKIGKIENLDKLTRLSSLNLYNNKIIQRIENLDKLTALTSLYLSGNEITRIEKLDKLTSLSLLDLQFNKIRCIDNLFNQSKLKSLDLRNNNIESVENIPEETKKILSGLNKLNLSDNPIKKGTIKNWNDKNEVLGYIMSLTEPRDPNTFLKLNIIGAGRIGKTQLIHFFQRKPFIKKENETHGTNTEIYTIPETNYQATIWDFGGQSYHHGFHKLFIREQDFNLVLWRNEEVNNADDKADNKADNKPDYGYWLGTARAFSAMKDDEGKYRSPLWLVQNVWTSTDYPDELKGFTPDVVHYPDSKKLLHYQVGFEQVFKVDVKSLFDSSLSIANKYFLHQLHEAMKLHATQIENVPKEFAKIKKQLDSKDFKSVWKIRKDTFKGKYAPEMDDNLFIYLLSYLEFSGNIISFNEKDGKGLLKDYILTSPPKLSDWMFNDVLKKMGIKENKGEFTREQLNETLQNVEDTELFLNILNQYDLVFIKDGVTSKKKYILPQYLPDYNHSFKKTLLKLLPYTFSLRFEDFLHEGRFFNFMSLYGEYAIDDTAYWKYGILFQYKKSIEVLVYYQTDNRQIFVHIEDKKGKTEIARELFDFFVFNKKTTTLQENAPASKEINGMVKDKEQRDFAGINLISLSTNSNQYFDIKETHQNIVAKNYFGICIQTQKRIPLDYMAINLLGNEAGRKHRIFFSYSHKDETYRDELDKHCTMLKRSGRIETWHDRKIVAGSDWNEKIKHQLVMADIVLLMISANFLHSDYIWEQELGIVRERLDKNDGICVIPIFVEECDTEGLDLMRFQGGTRDDQGKLRWIASEPNRAKLYLENVENIKKAIKEMQ